MNIHPRARTTPAIREEIQKADKTLTNVELAAKYGVSRLTIGKWRNAGRTTDASHRPHYLAGAKLTVCDMTIIREAKQKLMLPLDDLCAAVKGRLSCEVTRSRVSVVLARAKLTTHTRPKPPLEQKPFKEYPPGYLHVDTTYLPKLDGMSLKAFVAVDRATRMAFVSVSPKKTPKAAEAFIKQVKELFPLPITHVLTDNGTEFTWRKLAVKVKKAHPFELALKEMRIEHRCTKVKHPWTNGRVERLNRTMKAATINRTRYESAKAMVEDLHNWNIQYNLHTKLRTLGGITPLEAVQQHLAKTKTSQQSLKT